MIDSEINFEVDSIAIDHLIMYIVDSKVTYVSGVTTWNFKYGIMKSTVNNTPISFYLENGSSVSIATFSEAISCSSVSFFCTA